MSKPQRASREELARLQRECQQKLEEFMRAFEDEIEALTNRYPEGSELFFSGLDAASARLQRKMHSQMGHLHALAAIHRHQAPLRTVPRGTISTGRRVA